MLEPDKKKPKIEEKRLAEKTTKSDHIQSISSATFTQPSGHPLGLPKDIFLSILNKLSISDIGRVAQTTKATAYWTKKYLTEVNITHFLIFYGIFPVDSVNTAELISANSLPANRYLEIIYQFIKEISPSPSTSIGVIAKSVFKPLANNDSPLACYLKALEYIEDNTDFPPAFFALLEKAQPVRNAVYLELYVHLKNLFNANHKRELVTDYLVSEISRCFSQVIKKAQSADKNYLSLFELSFSFQSLLAFCINLPGSIKICDFINSTENNTRCTLSDVSLNLTFDQAWQAKIKPITGQHKNSKGLRQWAYTAESKFKQSVMAGITKYKEDRQPGYSSRLTF